MSSYQTNQIRFWTASRFILAALMMFAGAMHFLRTDVYVQIMPAFLPHPRALVLISGFFEVAGGLGLLVQRVSNLAAIGLILLFIAVFPANINMALANTAIAGKHYPLLLWLRLPLQLPLIAWAYSLTWHRMKEKSVKRT